MSFWIGVTVGVILGVFIQPLAMAVWLLRR